MKKYKNNVISMLLAIIMILCALPFGVGAVDDAKEAEITNRFNIMVDDDSPEYVKEIAEKSEIYDEFEVVSLREENVKHFALSDGTFEIVVYPYAIHEKSVDGAWAEKTDIQYMIEDDNNLDANEGVSRTNAHRIAQYYQIADNVISDTYVNSYSPSSNYGSSTQLYVGNSTMRAYFALPTPELPSNAKIIGSELNIRYWYNSTVTSGYVSVGVYEVTSYWNVSTLTWNNVQNGYGSIGSNTISTRNLHAGTSTTQSNPGSATIDVTSAVRDWYAGVENYGIALEYIGGTNSSVGICSLETSYYPLYTINYTLENLPVENGTHFLYNIQLERYLQIDPDATSPNQAYMEVWTYDGDTDQRWVVSYLHNGYYSITSESSGLSLAIKSGSENTNGGRVVQETYTANVRQQWAFSYSSRGNIVIRPRSGENFSTDWVMTTAFGILNGDGREVMQYAYSDNDDLKDEWIFYSSKYHFKYVHYYDSTFVGNSTLINNIKSATELSSVAYSRLCGLTFSMEGSATQYTTALADQCTHSSNEPCTTSDCGNNCVLQHHRNIIRMSNQLYNNGQYIDSGYRYVLWSNRSYGTYCAGSNGTHIPFYAIAAVYDFRPIINFYTIDGTVNVKKACMTLNLAHETAHTFNMYDVYDNIGHDVDNATVCVMERFDSATAYAFYNNILDGKVDAFCESCTATLRQLVLNKISEET